MLDLDRVDDRRRTRRAFSNLTRHAAWLVKLGQLGHAARTLIGSVAFGRCCRALGLAVFTLGVPRLAAAFPTSRLVYSRAPGTEQCPDQEIVRRAVATRLGYDPFFPSSDKTIVARIWRDGEQLKGDVELVDEHGLRLGRREFTGAGGECADLVRAMALSISIAIDPKSAETYGKGPPDEPAAGASAEPVAAAPEPPAAPPPAVPRGVVPASEPPRLASVTAPALVGSAGLGLSALFELVPKTTLGAFGFASVQRGRWSLGLEGRADLPVTAKLRGVDLRASSYALSVAPCWHVGFAFACELSSLGLLSATGVDSGSKSGTRALVSVGARLGAELSLLPSLGLILQADGLISPWPVELVAQGNSLWRSPVLAGALGLAGVVHFR